LAVAEDYPQKTGIIFEKAARKNIRSV